MKLKMPTRIDLLGNKIKIEYHYELDEDLGFEHDLEIHGACSPNDNIIYIGTKVHTTEEAIRATLFHELIHYVLDKTGVKNLFSNCGKEEETVVTCLENILWPLLTFDRRYWKHPKYIYIGPPKDDEDNDCGNGRQA